MISFKQIIFSLALMLFAQLLLFAQVEDKKAYSVENIPFVRFQYSYHAPAGDFEARYGNSNEVGGAFGFKTIKNWLFEIEGGYHFTKQVKTQGLLDDVLNKAGDATDSDGELVRITYELRGLSFFATAGKIIPLNQKQKNSGLLLQVGAGYLQHRIKVDWRDGKVYQFSDERLKGYDRLHTGFATKQFIGYKYFGNNNIVNFYAGLEFKQAFTKNRRKYNYDTKSYDTGSKFDFLYGIRVGWMIPFRSRESEEFYIY